MLGSDSFDISLMFLFEASVPGFAGGVAGVILSQFISHVLNDRVVRMLEFAEGTRVFDIPAWIIAAAIGGAALVATLAALAPEKWAAGVKPLEALAGVA